MDYINRKISFALPHKDKSPEVLVTSRYGKKERFSAHSEHECRQWGRLLSDPT